MSSDGYELTFAVNHLAPFLLTHLLAEALKSAAPSRIVTTASNAHRRATMSFDDLQTTRNYTAMGAYGSSKLANILFTRTLAKRLHGTAVTATCLHPGFVRTGIGRGFHSAPWLKRFVELLLYFGRSPEKGAETLIYLASSAGVQGASGGYYFDCKPTLPAPAGQDDDAAERLWQETERLVGMA